MLDAMEPGQLNEWIAFNRLEYDTEAALERVAAILQRGFAAVLEAAGCKNVPRDMFEPDAKRHVGDSPQAMKPEHVAQRIDAFPKAW